jgi:DNA-directed RNA polymerase subunit A'
MKCHGFIIQSKNSIGESNAKCEKFLRDIKYIKKNDRLSMAAKLAISIIDCPFCGYKNPKYSIKREDNTKIFMEPRKDSRKSLIKNEKSEYAVSQRGKYANVLLPSIALHILSDFPAKELKILGYDSKSFHPSYLIMSNIPVIPNCARPDNYSKKQKYEDELVREYKHILTIAKKIDKNTELTDKPDEFEKFVNNLDALTISIGGLFGVVKKAAKGFNIGKKSDTKSFWSRIVGKRSRIRMNILGKRINGSGRTAISPEVKFEFDHVGVPIKYAKKLTVQVIVNKGNINDLTRYIRNGPNKYPGANSIITKGANKDGIERIKRLSNVAPDYLAKLQLHEGDKVERHLIDEDWCMFNRNPSLHKYSFNGFRIFVLPKGDTFRMPTVCCKPFNADFDGDEMHMVFFNKYTTFAEIKYISQITNSVVTEKDSGILIQPIQDTVAGFYLLASTDRVFSREEFMQIINDCHISGIIIPQDSGEGFTGKDILSFIMPTITIENPNYKIVNGKLISGKFGKSTINNIISELLIKYGQEFIKNFIYNIIQITNWTNRYLGMTACYSDTVCDKSQKEEIDEMINYAKIRINGLLDDIQKDKFIVPIGTTIKEYYEERIKNIYRESMDKMINVVKRTKSKKEDNNFILISLEADSKAKLTNLTQMIGCLEQIQDGSERIHMGYKNRSFVFYPKFEENIESRGFVSNSYYSGLNFVEYTTHGIGGRHGLIDTAIMTAFVGYVSRRWWSLLNNVYVAYDGTVRNNTGIIIQNIYGGDGFMISKTTQTPIETLTKTEEELKKEVIS